MSEQHGTAPEAEQTQAVSEQPQDVAVEPKAEQEAPKKAEEFDWKMARLRREQAKVAKRDAELAEMRMRVELLERAQQGEQTATTQPQPQEVNVQAIRESAQRQAMLELQAQGVARAGMSEFADYQVKVGTLMQSYQDELGQRPDIFEAVFELDDPHKMIYHLAQNPGELEALLDLSPAKLGAKLGLMSARGTHQKPKPVSKAPAPPSPIKDTGTTPTGYHPDMTDAEYAAMRKASGSKWWR